jgi:Secretion system C-terminal sorting domain
MKTLNKKGLLGIILCIGIQYAIGQCNALSAVGSCSGGTGPATNNVNINNGQVRWFSGTGTFTSGLNINNGGTLRVCGNLTLSSINFNGGTIIIESGGTLTINGSGTLNLNGNTRISNRGTLNINRSVTLQNNNNIIVNAGTLNMNSGNYQLELNSNSSYFSNYGIANIRTIFTQGSANINAVCLGTASCMNLTNLNNNRVNAFTTTGGEGSIRYTGNAALNSSLTNSASVVVCRATGATASGNITGFGSARIISNCPSCLYALPVDLEDFEAKKAGNTIQLEWATRTETNHDFFAVEWSDDGLNWQEIARIKDGEQIQDKKKYIWVHTAPVNGLNHYRLKQQDLDGKIKYTSIISYRINRTQEVSLYPNPTTGTVTLHVNGNFRRQQLRLADTQGRLVNFRLGKSTSNSIVIDLSALSPGIYFLQYEHEIMRVLKK